MLKVYHCDLHIHTCLSPCAELDMHPQALVDRALEKNLDIIAISDHNASANVPYVQAAAAGKNIRIVPAMEITTREEVHLLALLENLFALRELQTLIDRHLFGENDEDRFGVQAVVNERGEVEELNNQLLIGATDLSIDEIVDTIHRLKGLAIPAHIDRESFSVLGQLGFIDDNAHFDALEISGRTGLAKGRLQYPELRHYPFVTSSDAHFVRDIGTATTPLLLEAPTFAEIKMALAGQNGRRIVE
ncbi:MAG: PHP domain-containing protein [Smithellaceae bacterium]|nr:PHP domain-containing protein [Syntrophaceae bacterium]MDD4240782.1 PHP domain-containing protein [Smithellaceae bacterium]NLX51765.1 PHP domain-containing protein [Deltaproteobacteria bacterium]